MTTDVNVNRSEARCASEPGRIPAIPLATYRLQFNQAFTFYDAARLIPYLRELGVSHCYASPLFKARAGSSHGYDVCDFGQLNPELGGDEGFEAFHRAAEEAGLGLILDIVPNHMGIVDEANSWWTDVLENGPSSIYAEYFDLDWDPVRPALENKVLLPILGDQYGRVLESGKLRLAYEDGAFVIYHYETKLPVTPNSYSQILSGVVAALEGALEPDHEHLLELASILTAIDYLPRPTEVAPERIAERNREKEVIKRRIATLWEASSEVRSSIEAVIRAFNGSIDDPRSFDQLDELLNAQCYRLAFWRVATEEINYRRFFDVNDLAAIRVERPEVFEATHALILRLLIEGKASGLRVDHVDGLWDPPKYLRQLQDSYADLLARTESAPREDGPAHGMASGSHSASRVVSGAKWPLYVVAEKVLVDGERLPEDWAVYGTTGYDFLNAINGLFVDGSNRRAFDRIYRDFTGVQLPYRDLVNSTKKMIMLISLASEINALSSLLERIADANRRYRDFTLNSLTYAIREVIACLPVYRTYITGAVGPVAGRDQAVIEAAVREVKRRNPRTAGTIFDFIRDTLLFRHSEDFRAEERDRLSDFVMKFQQVSGPVMAKGVEDTAFYVYNRLVSLNEVGGNPEQFGQTTEAFHRQNAERQRRWPHSLLATATHDTKRGEDLRARIDVLSEMPREWRALLTRWGRHNARRKKDVDGAPAPSRNDEYLLYQTILGAWPDEPLSSEEFGRFRERIAAYMLKATKEAKVHTSWVNANEEYDDAVRQFVTRVLSDNPNDPFFAVLRQFQRRVAFYGRLNSLAQTLLKLTSPGVPDIYQGTELWDLSLVDPDNRRPVDYDRRRALLAQLCQQCDSAGPSLTALADDLVEHVADGRIKLYLINRALGFRRAHEALFSAGAYQPLAAHGGRQDHVVAFRRISQGEAAIVVAPWLVVGLTDGVEQAPLGERIWGDTRLLLPDDAIGAAYWNVLTGEVLTADEQDGGVGLPLASICGHFPVSLLERVARERQGK